MNHDSVFFKAKISLALWYAGVMGIILGLSGLGAYQVMAHAHWQGVDQELMAVSGNLHDALEPNLEETGKISLSSSLLMNPANPISIAMF